MKGGEEEGEMLDVQSGQGRCPVVSLNMGTGTQRGSEGYDGNW